MEQTWKGNADLPWAVGSVVALTATIAVSCALSAALPEIAATPPKPPGLPPVTSTVTAKLRTTLTGHTDKVYAAAFSPDGKIVATSSRDTTIKLWDVTTSRELRTLRGHTGWVQCVAFSPDGKMLASTGFTDATVKLWDVATGDERITLTGEEGSVQCVAFSPDGKTLASGSRGPVTLWDWTTRQKRATLDGHTGWVQDIAFSPNGKILATSARDGTVRLWDVTTERELRTLRGHTGWVQGIAFSPDGKTLASGSHDRTVKLWDAQTGRQRATFRGHTNYVLSLAFSQDGRTLATGSHDRTVMLWDAQTGQLRGSIFAHQSGIFSIAFSPDGKTLATGSWDGTAKLWDIGTEAKPADVGTKNRTASHDRREYIEAFRKTKDGSLVRERVPVYTPKTNTRRSGPEVPRSYRAPGGKTRASRSSNQGGVVCFLAFVGMIGVVIAFVLAAKHGYRTAEAYSRLATRYGGTCDSGGWPSRPKVNFMHAGSQVVVDINSTGGEHPTRYTQVHFCGRQPTVRCEVYPEGLWSRLGKWWLMGMEDIEIGSPDFDDQYIITGDDHAALRDLLNPAVQQQIERLRRFLGNGNIYVSFNRHELLVKKLSFIRDYNALLEFTELAIGLYDQAVLTAEKGIEFVGDATPPEVTEAVCQICGETIQANAVLCRRCKTPHHLDCWEYYGACSTYGCGERRYLLPKPRRGKKPGKDTDSSRRTPKVPFDRHTRRGV